MRNFVVLLILVLAAPALAQQLNPKDVLSGLALRDSFRDRRVTNRSLFAETVAAPTVDYYVTTGVSYSDAGGGVSTTGLPQELEVDFNRTNTKVLFDIDAYDWARGPGTRLSGVGDPSLEVVQRLWCSNPPACGADSDSISVAASITVPTGTEVSAGTGGQMVKLLYGHNFMVDHVKLSVRLDHINDSSPGVSAYATTGKFYYQHDFSDTLDVFANLTYSHQSGAGNVTSAGVGVDFPIYQQPAGPFKNISGTLLGSCALSGSHHCGRVELDFVLPFK